MKEETPIIRAENLEISFKTKTHFGSKKQLIKAVDNASFSLGRGESIGIIGRNGAGKSTLLRALAGIIKPNAGRVIHNTDSISLLSLGVGYEPALPAKNNVILNGMLLGISRREMKEKLHEIFEFAELTDFVDMPIKNYSSGMRARLAFSTTAHVRSDVMLIDEILAVGDQKFRQKSEQVMEERISSGDTVVLVSHQGNVIRKLCDRAIWFEHGKVVNDGPAAAIMDEYESESSLAEPT